MSRIKPVHHFIFWTSLYLYFLLTDWLQNALILYGFVRLLTVVCYACSYYLLFCFIFPVLYERRGALIVAVLLVFSLFLTGNYFLYQWSVTAAEEPVFLIFPDEVIKWLITYVWIVIIAMQVYRNKKVVETMQLTAQRDRILLLKELGFFKNQFDSHTVFNFLNYCYNKVHKKSVETAEAIEVFSRMLRYSLNNKSNEKVSLENEIEYIDDFIKLQKLLTSELNTQFLVKEGNYSSSYILPRVLMAIVENAFKHGNLCSKENPITISVELLPDCLSFSVSNEKKKQKNTEPSGIGHFNLKQQLELLYKNKYTFSINETHTLYSCNLKLII